MTRIIVDPQTRNKLLNLAEPLDLCDESGKLLGVFTPLSELEAAERARPPISDEELAKRLDEPDYSTEEVLAYLQKL
jgi:hypothetical protein